MLAGDFYQMDLEQEESGIHDFFEISKKIKGFKIVTFQEGDIVRNDFIRDYILAKNEYDREKRHKTYTGHQILRTSKENVHINGHSYRVEETAVN